MIQIKPALPPEHVLVRFGDHIGADAQGRALLAMEKFLRTTTGLDVRVFKERMGDDSKLRVKMTPEERSRL
jgi:hypothetical protein